MEKQSNEKQPGPRCSKLPSFSNLEIRGVWDGDIDQPVDLKVFLDVQCVPNTKLQIFNAKDADVAAIRSFSVRLQSNEWGNGNQSMDDSPQSPLFSFSTPSSDDGEIASSTIVECTPRRTSSLSVDAIPETQNDATSSRRGSYSELPDYEDVESLPQHPTPSRMTSRLSLNIAKCQDWSEMQNLGKRSATEACLTDSETEAANRKSEAKGTSSRKGSKLNDSPALARSKQEISTGHQPESPQHSRSSSRNSNKASMIPIPSRSMRAPAFEGPPSDLLSRDHLSYKQATRFTEKSRDVSLGSEFTVYGDDHGIPPPAGSESNRPDVMNAELDQKAKAAKIPDPEAFRQATVTDIVNSPPSNKTLPANVDQNDVRFTPSTSMKPEEATLPRLAIPKFYITKATPSDDDKCPSIHEDEPCEPSAGEPKLEIFDGILYVKSPANVRPATYKFSFIVSIQLRKGKAVGWRYLIVPGLPKLKPRQTGDFLFLIPENQGMVFGTTHLKRWDTVEGCFVATFQHPCNNLVIPLRACSSKMYALTKGFTIDQQIRADHQIDNVVKDDEPSILVRYTAMCSVRVHNRCFWTEKCCFFLTLDGGPKGNFELDMDPEKKGVQMLALKSNLPVGTSHIRITCPPKHLHLFGVSWTVTLPGNEVKKWLPRIYPKWVGTSGDERERLRDSITYLPPDFWGRDEGTYDVEIVDDLETQVDDVGDGKAVAAPGCCEHCIKSLNSATLTLACQTCVIQSGSVIGNTTHSTAPKLHLIIAVLFGIIAFGYINSVLGPSHYLDVLGSIQETAGSIFIDEPCVSRMQSGESDFWCRFIKNPFHSITTAGEGVLPESSPAIDDATTDSNDGASVNEVNAMRNTVEKEPANGAEEKLDGLEDLNAASHHNLPIQNLSFRDRIDFWLGWRGPVGRDK